MSFPNIEACHKYAKPHRKCPYAPKDFGKCYSFCDLDSDKVCGDCAHWLGYWGTDSVERNKKLGGCFYKIGVVPVKMRTNCEHYTERKPDEPNWDDWVEKRVLELGGAPDSAPFSRKCRIQARKEWAEAHN